MWKCVACGGDNEDNFEHCWNCTTGKDGSPAQNAQAFETAQKRKTQQPETSSQKVQSPVQNLPIIPFFVRVLPTIGFITLALCVFAGLGLFAKKADSSYGDSTPYGWYGIALIIQGILFCGLLQAVEYAVRLLRSIASSVNR